MFFYLAIDIEAFFLINNLLFFLHSTTHNFPRQKQRLVKGLCPVAPFSTNIQFRLFASASGEEMAGEDIDEGLYSRQLYVSS